jgi:hypothetical protein
VALALHRLGVFAADPKVHAHGGRFQNVSPAGYTPEWVQWADRFAALSVAGKAGARQLRYFIWFVGRWALVHHEEASRGPADWDVEIAADFAAFIVNGKIGDLEQKPSIRDAARFLWNSLEPEHQGQQNVDDPRVLRYADRGRLDPATFCHAYRIPPTPRDCKGRITKAPGFSR